MAETESPKVLENTVGNRDSGHNDGDHRHELDQNVERRAGGVLEGVAHGVADDGGLLLLALLGVGALLEAELLAELL